MNIFSDVLFVVSVICLVVCVAIFVVVLAIEISKCFLSYEERPVKVTVVNKKHIAQYSSTSFIPTGKVVTPQIYYHPEEYQVYVKWREKIYHINNEELFNNVKKDDVVEVVAHLGYNKSAVEKDAYLTYK